MRSRPPTAPPTRWPRTAARSRSNPGFGGAWWSLANLKTVRFDAGDIEAMRVQLRRDDLDDDARLHFEFALGKALEDAGDHADAFAHYARGNALRRSQLPYDAALRRERTRARDPHLYPRVLRRTRRRGLRRRPIRSSSSACRAPAPP